MPTLRNLERKSVVSKDRLLSAVAVSLAAFTGLFFYVGVGRLGQLARSEREFEFGLLVLFLGVLIFLCLGALVCVYQQLHRRIGA